MSFFYHSNAQEAYSPVLNGLQYAVSNLHCQVRSNFLHLSPQENNSLEKAHFTLGIRSQHSKCHGCHETQTQGIYEGRMKRKRAHDAFCAICYKVGGFVPDMSRGRLIYGDLGGGFKLLQVLKAPS